MTVIGNEIYDCSSGIRTYCSQYHTLRSNKIYNCNYGIDLYYNFLGNTIECNKMLDCNIGVYYSGSGTISTIVGTPLVASDNYWDNCNVYIQNNSTANIDWYYLPSSPELNPAGNVLGVNTLNPSGIVSNSCNIPARKNLVFDDEKEVLVYPNPTNGKLTVESIHNDEVMMLYNTLGSRVFLKELQLGENVVRLDFLPKGVYHLVLKTGNEILKPLIYVLFFTN
jgi:parallel beta-helix repeat protein